MKLNIKLALLAFLSVFLLTHADAALASQNPSFQGYVRSQTGAPVAGASVKQTSYNHPTECSSSDQNGNPTGCRDLPAVERASRVATTDQNGFFSFAGSTSFNCASNPQIFNTTVSSGSCQTVDDEPNNFSVSRDVNIICNVGPPPTPTPPPPPPPPPACNMACQRDDQCLPVPDGCTSCINSTCQKLPVCGNTCTSKADCANVRDGCTECLPAAGGTASGSASTMTCQPPPPPACNAFCSTNKDCVGNKEGCSECVAGQCRVPPACDVSCTKNEQCTGAKDGCTACLPAESGVGSVCRPPAACNASCTSDSYCQNAKDGCTSCLPSDTGSGNVCRPPAACNAACTSDNYCQNAKDGCNICSGGTCKAPACGVACTKDGQCAGAKDGCTACVGGVCKIPPACGVACTTKADCSGAKDSCDQCLEGTCTDFNDNMCKCDGITADLSYPSSAFKFEAFGKVEGADTKKAEIADITFRLTKDNQVIAKSNPITPEVVENSANKLRFKAAWQTPPPPVSKTSTYRVFADVRCKPKKIVASANQTFSPNPDALAVAKVWSVPPKGLELTLRVVNSLFGENNKQLKPITDKVLAMFSTSTVNAQQSNLQLQTLKFVKMMETDNCRFVMFKFDESLF